MERAAQQATDEKALRFPAQICRMTVRAQAASQLAQQNLTEVVDHLGARGLTTMQVGVTLAGNPCCHALCASGSYCI